MGFIFLPAGIWLLATFPEHAKNDWGFPLVRWSFIVVGAYVLLWRRWIVLDRGKGVVEEKSGLLFPLRSRVLKLSPETRVYLQGKGVTDSDPSGQGSTGYSIYISDLKKEVFLYQCGRNRSEAVKRAEEVAGFLNLDIVDGSSGEEVIRKPEDFGHPV